MQRPALGDVPSGMFLAGGICAGLVQHVAHRQGVRGRHVVAELRRCGRSGPTWRTARSPATRCRDANLGAGTMSPLVGVHRTKDSRWLMLSMLDEERYWAPTCRALELPELIDRYPTADERRPHWPEFVPMFAAQIASVTRAELEPRLARRGLHLLVLRVAARSARRSGRRSTTATRWPIRRTRICGWRRRPCSSTTSFPRCGARLRPKASTPSRCSRSSGYDRRRDQRAVRRRNRRRPAARSITPFTAEDAWTGTRTGC